MLSALGERGARAELLGRLRLRLEQAAELEDEMRRGLRDADATRIEAATCRLETVALEVKLLAAELDRFPAGADIHDPDVQRARAELDETATRLARSSAVGGGLLERLIGLSRRLTKALDAGTETYLYSGVARERTVRGLTLEEEA